MTCIVGLNYNNKVYIGGDSAGVSGLSISVRSDPKVFVNGPFIMGFTTSFRMGQLLRFKFKPPKRSPKIKDDYEFMVTSFIDKVKDVFASNDFGNKDANEGGTFLVGYNGKLYIIYDDYQVKIPSDDYASVGCGFDLALGAMYATQEKEPEVRIKLALEAASKFSAGVSPPFVILKQ